MIDIFGFFQALKEHGILVSLFTLISVALLYVILSYLREACKTLALIRAIFQSCADPENPQRTMSRAELKHAIEDTGKNVEDLGDNLAKICSVGRCPVHDRITSLREEIHSQFQTFTTEARVSREETKGMILGISTNVTRVSDEFLGFIKLLIERIRS